MSAPPSAARGGGARVLPENESHQSEEAAMCRLRSLAQVGGLAAGLLLVGQCLAPSRQDDSRSPPRLLMPRWNWGSLGGGDDSRPIKSGASRANGRPADQWQFSVERFEKSLENDCCRVRIPLSGRSVRPSADRGVDRPKVSGHSAARHGDPCAGRFQTITQATNSQRSGRRSRAADSGAARSSRVLCRRGKGTQTFFLRDAQRPRRAKALATWDSPAKLSSNVAALP